MRTDLRVGGGASAHVYRHPLLSCISVFFECVAGVVDPVARRRVRWTPQAASVAAVLMAIDNDVSLVGRFGHVWSCMKRDHGGRRRTGGTYNGLLKALERQATVTLPLVKAALRDHVRRRLARIDPTCPWVLLAVDGSKTDLPRTVDHERTFGIADNGIYPQAFITAVVEVHTGLLWDWRMGPARASEKMHLKEMIADLPGHALLLADGAFIGSPIWNKLCAKGQPFLIRVGGNVSLLTGLWPQAITRREGSIVYVWPRKTRQDHAPLKLRLIRVGSRAKTVYLLTNVLDPRRLSRKAAGTIYRKRWGVELFYRALKRTLGCAKLRSKAARRARIELEWTLVAMTIITLLGIHAVVKRRCDPRILSPAQLLRTLRAALRDARSQGSTVAAALQRDLASCLRDTYQRSRPRQSRHRIVTRNTPKTPTKPPLIREATPQERKDALKYQTILAA